MAVTFDQALGTGAQSVPGATAGTVTTTGAVPAGGMVVFKAGRFNSAGTTLTASGGGLTWATGHTIASGSIRLYLFYAFAPAGLASGTVLSATPSAASNDFTMCAASYLGVDSAVSPVAFGGAAASTAAWATGSIAASSGNALIGGAYGDGALSTSTPTGPAVERVDFNSATTSGSITLVDKLSVAGSDSLAGTWSGALGHIALGVAFQAAAGGGAATPPALTMAPRIPTY